MDGEERKRNGKSTFLKTNNSVPLDRGSHINARDHRPRPKRSLSEFSRTSTRAVVTCSAFVRLCLSSVTLANKSLILIVSTNPEPHNVSTRLHRQGAVMDPYPDRPKLANFLKVEERMRRILFEKLIVFIR